MKNKFALFRTNWQYFTKIYSFTLGSQYICSSSSLFFRQDHVPTNSLDNKVQILATDRLTTQIGWTVRACAFVNCCYFLHLPSVVIGFVAADADIYFCAAISWFLGATIATIVAVGSRYVGRADKSYVTTAHTHMQTSAQLFVYTYVYVRVPAAWLTDCLSVVASIDLSV